LTAYLLDGTKIHIEVIKSSEVSENKTQHLKENKLPTFIIYIDDNGNQINDRFNFIGNEEIEDIERQITRTKQLIITSEEERRRAWGEYYTEEKRNTEEIRSLSSKLSGISIYGAGKTNDIREKIYESTCYSEILRSRVRKIENKIDYEKEFRTLAVRCNKEWFGNKWMHPEIGTDKLTWIKYWTS
jgi:hypothetical protein